MITAMMLADQDRQKIELAVRTFRLFNDVDISLVIVDKGSVDGLGDWAAEQTDLTYVLIDEKPVGWGKAINMVKRELNIDTDLLILEGQSMLMPQCLSRLEKWLHEKENIGGVCGVFGGEDSYEKAMENAGKEKGAKTKRAMFLHPGAVLWKKEALEEIGEFEEEIESWFMVMRDYCLRMVEADKELLVCSDAVFWNGKGNMEFSGEEWEEAVLERKWGMHYFNGHCNERIVSMIDAESDRKIAVLEIGCDCGATLLEIKNQHPKAQVYGTEINGRAASVAAHFAQVTVNNIEDRNMPFDKGMFDYIIFGDVLEHLHDPLGTLKYCRDYLSGDGMVIVSVPNVMHISVMEQLLRGNFTYTETGLLDRTHIHLFTCNEIIRTLDKAGYEVCDLDCIYFEISSRQNSLIDSLLAVDQTAQRFMYETAQYILKAKRLDGMANGKRESGYENKVKA